MNYLKGNCVVYKIVVNRNEKWKVRWDWSKEKQMIEATANYSMLLGKWEQWRLRANVHFNPIFIAIIIITTAHSTLN